MRTPAPQPPSTTSRALSLRRTTLRISRHPPLAERIRTAMAFMLALLSFGDTRLPNLGRMAGANYKNYECITSLFNNGASGRVREIFTFVLQGHVRGRASACELPGAFRLRMAPLLALLVLNPDGTDRPVWPVCVGDACKRTTGRLILRQDRESMAACASTTRARVQNESGNAPPISQWRSSSATRHKGACSRG